MNHSFIKDDDVVGLPICKECHDEVFSVEFVKPTKKETMKQ